MQEVTPVAKEDMNAITATKPIGERSVILNWKGMIKEGGKIFNLTIMVGEEAINNTMVLVEVVETNVEGQDSAIVGRRPKNQNGCQNP